MCWAQKWQGARGASVCRVGMLGTLLHSDDDNASPCGRRVLRVPVRVVGRCRRALWGDQVFFVILVRGRHKGVDARTTGVLGIGDFRRSRGLAVAGGAVGGSIVVALEDTQRACCKYSAKALS